MTDTARASGFPRLILYAAVLILIAAIAYGVSRNKTSDGIGALKPSATNSTGGASSPDQVIASLEAQTKKNPKDVESWQLLGWSYFEAGRYQDAADAYTKATQLAPERGVYWSSLGEALVMASESDPMPKNAAAAFDKAISLDKKDPRARYFLAVRKDLTGDNEGAIKDWLALLVDTPKEAPWESDLVRTIEQVGKIHDIKVADRIAKANGARGAIQSLPAGSASKAVNSVAAAPIPGPSKAEMAQASKLPPGQQQQMVISMVEGLESKLAKNPANVDGWIMLMRSRMTLGETVKAASALKKAIAANPASRDKLKLEAQVLGVPGA